MAEADRLAPTSDANFVSAKNRSILSRLYTGTGAFEIVGRRRMWFMITAAMVIISLASIGFRGFTLGIEFEGGTQISFPKTGDVSTSQVEETYSNALGEDPQTVQTAGSGGSQTVQIRTETLNAAELVTITNALADEFEIAPNDVSSSDVSSTWGGEITEKALIALLVFLVLVTIYIAIRFDKEMALAAMAALFFDIATTAGIYSLVGFEVTPATVIGFLAILGFSLYDTVVVFDKVEENVRGVLHTSRRTYAEQANLAVNQTLMRSINTTVISVLPVLSLMVIAVWLLGVGTLKDLGLVQMVGVITGTYSSIFFATPLLVTLKERRRDIGSHTRKVLAKRVERDTRGSGAIETGSAGPGSTTTLTKTAPAARRTAVSPQPGARPSGKRRRKR
ncbi:protein translocase subunit secF [Williamsia limnetica]|jgi:preprotein translocase subunit SecF|uniref:Protein-export membrane protein SecF n=1 Tax=Williamsia limnetica TaxID=882452 RepID=A0A318RWR1_WILLI|nr:protein translocase subunit SecF [Williamsia limnetica]PYE21073.1 protein translocase subunit secF [Williamsia limnetica]